MIWAFRGSNRGRSHVNQPKCAAAGRKYIILPLREGPTHTIGELYYGIFGVIDASYRFYGTSRYQLMVFIG